jgi:hypothetical protein
MVAGYVVGRFEGEIGDFVGPRGLFGGKFFDSTLDLTVGNNGIAGYRVRV